MRLALALLASLAIGSNVERQGRLHVRDALTGAELTDVEVVRVRDWMTDKNDHPGNPLGTGTIKGAVLSPLGIPVTQNGSSNYHVRAPGYAWNHVQLHVTDKDYYVDLVHGGRLEVHLQGAKARKDARLRLRSDGRLIADCSFSGEHVVIESLVPGDYSVQVELGYPSHYPLAFGRALATVVAGDSSEVVLTIEEPRPVAKVPLAGTLVLPPEWTLPGASMVVDYLGTRTDGGASFFGLDLAGMKLIDALTGTWRWEAGDVDPGHYRLVMNDVEYSSVVEVGPLGNTNVLFEIPPPCTMSVTVVDDMSGEKIDVALVAWACRHEGSMSIGGDLASREPQLQAVFRVPQTTLELYTFSDDYWDEPTIFVPRPGTNELTLHVLPHQGIRLKLEADESPIHWNWDWNRQVRIQAKGSETREAERYLIDAGLQTFIKKPGTYSVELPQLAGFRMLEPREVEVLAGEVTDLLVFLQRLN